MEYSQDSEFVHGLFREFSSDYGEGELSSEQVSDAYDVIENRYGSENVNLEDVDLEEFSGDGVEISIDGFEDSPVYASDSHCVTWGNDTSGGPPEGPAKDGKGNDLFGVR